MDRRSVQLREYTVMPWWFPWFFGIGMSLPLLVDMYFVIFHKHSSMFSGISSVAAPPIYLPSSAGDE